MTSNSLSAIETCVGFNTYAIRLMRESRHCESSQMLRVALEHLKPCMGLPANDQFVVPTHVQSQLQALQAKEEQGLPNQPHLPCVSSVPIPKAFV